MSKLKSSDFLKIWLKTIVKIWILVKNGYLQSMQLFTHQCLPVYYKNNNFFTKGNSTNCVLTIQGEWENNVYQKTKLIKNDLEGVSNLFISHSNGKDQHFKPSWSF